LRFGRDVWLCTQKRDEKKKATFSQFERRGKPPPTGKPKEGGSQKEKEKLRPSGGKRISGGGGGGSDEQSNFAKVTTEKKVLFEKRGKGRWEKEKKLNKPRQVAPTWYGRTTRGSPHPWEKNKRQKKKKKSLRYKDSQREGN